ncbi:unnamed protein product [marine sediment metagenome]|uniref:Uncharacterized protein n=1 Tax=marine sediment metagenome TaxID=412755 RepID=X1L7Z1_9ZZZZ
MVWTPDKSHRMGNDYAHKTDKASKTDCHRGNQGGSTQQYKLNPFHIDAQLLRLLLIKLHHIKGSSMKPDNYNSYML